MALLCWLHGCTKPVVAGGGCEDHETRETIARRADWEQYKKDYNAGLIPQEVGT